MKHKIYLLLIIVFISCKSDMDIIIDLVFETKLTPNSNTKLKDLKTIDEDMYILPISPILIKEFHKSVTEQNEYYTVRYLLKTNTGVYRMFYLIDLTKKKILLKSNKFEDFYKPINQKIFSGDIEYMKGDNLLEIYRY
ncbi:MAG: hypothetical protein ACSHXA_07630 [Polaribacter sp.]|uniref:hypothetical protein n=1 Tax=Polaribacter sp. TaxID=1920175 RepID=UPI003EF9A94F